MPGYGVPDSPDGLLPWAWAEERLVRTRNYWVVTVSADGRPHSLPTWGVWSPEDSVFWFSSSSSSRKARNLAANPQMVVTTDDSVEVVSVEGTGTPISDLDRDRMAQAFAAKYEAEPDARPAMAEFVKSNAVYELAPARAFGIIETPEDFSNRATKWVW
jgi:nitroimidazol reductase NimA-like FMN-containing flavoprotein (pyridoxamine 5'-phosphate oxidase superfamily)